MIFIRSSKVLLIALAAVLSVVLSPLANAQNAEFQDFFFQVCNNPSGALAARCAETDGADGNLSGDSESSLNPSQALSGADTAFFAAQQRIQEMGDALADKRSDEPATTIQIGPWSILANVHSTSVDTDRDPGREAERGFELDEIGFDLGADYRVTEHFILGAMLHFTDGDLQFDGEDAGRNFDPGNNAGDMESRSWGLTGYFSRQLGDTGYVDGSLGIARLDMDLTRNAVFQESNRAVPQFESRTAAAANSDQFYAMLNAGITRSIGGWDITPSVGLSHIATSVDDYTESDLSGAGLAMRFTTADRDGTFGHVGATLTRAISMDGWVLIPQLSVEYVNEFSDDLATATAAYVNDAGQNVFAFDGLGDDRSRVDWSLGAIGVLPNGWMSFVEYQQSSGMGTFERFSVVGGIRVEL